MTAAQDWYAVADELGLGGAAAAARLSPDAAGHVLRLLHRNLLLRFERMFWGAQWDLLMGVTADATATPGAENGARHYYDDAGDIVNPVAAAAAAAHTNT